MEKRVQLRLIGKQYLEEEKRTEKIEYTVEGRLWAKGDAYYLVYQEKAEGLQGARTILKIEPAEQALTLLRSSPFKTRQYFKPGQQEVGSYGELSLEILTHNLELQPGRIKISYSLYFQGMKVSKNELKIIW